MPSILICEGEQICVYACVRVRVPLCVGVCSVRVFFFREKEIECMCACVVERERNCV